MSIDINLVTVADLDKVSIALINGKISVVDTPIKEYTLTFTNKATTFLTAQVNDVNRRKMLVKGGFGILHLDFKSLDTTVNSNSSSAVHLFTLPANSPTPAHLIEQQTFDGGVIYIEAGSRNVFGIVNSNVRYVENLVGFFR